jgi:hypothetical protein
LNQEQLPRVFPQKPHNSTDFTKKSRLPKSNVLKTYLILGPVMFKASQGGLLNCPDVALVIGTS